MYQPSLKPPFLYWTTFILAPSNGATAAFAVLAPQCSTLWAEFILKDIIWSGCSFLWPTFASFPGICSLCLFVQICQQGWGRVELRVKHMPDLPGALSSIFTQQELTLGSFYFKSRVLKHHTIKTEPKGRGLERISFKYSGILGLDLFDIQNRSNTKPAINVSTSSSGVATSGPPLQ